VELPGGEIVEPADVVRLVGSTYVLVFDADARGVPAIVTGGPGTPTAPPPPGPCVGDCDDNGTVAINELITKVNIALGS
jgi:hypothetical protein